MSRPEWSEWFLAIADVVAQRGDCRRRQVGAVLVRPDRTVASVGYNGSWPGGPSCLAGECPRGLSDVEPGSSYDTGPGTCHAQHAEMNTLANAREGTVGYWLYVSSEPCNGCVKVARAHRLDVIIWPGGQLDLWRGAR